MRFEALPNEILLQLFEFVDVASLLRSFFGLNNRFTALLASHLSYQQLNLRRISKDHFDWICAEPLPCLIDSVRSLYLSNQETPHLCRLLFARGFTLDRFVHLQSLTLHHIHPLRTLVEITAQCRSLVHLTHLDAVECNFEEKLAQRSVLNLFNNVCSIPALVDFRFNGIHLQQVSLPLLTAVSWTLHDLAIQNISCDFSTLSHLLSTSTPCLQRLTASVYSHSVEDRLLHVVPSLVSLTLTFDGCVDSLKNVFAFVPNLTNLSVQTLSICIDGHEWQQLFDRHLLHLRTFHLKMKLQLPGSDYEVEQRVDELLDSFRTPYWIEQRRWCVQCDWESSEIVTHAYLYTLPFAFSTVHCLQDYRTKTTGALIDSDHSYDLVHKFESNVRKNLYLHKFNELCSRFRNLHCLDIILPVDANIHSCDTLLRQLTSLTARIQISTGYDQLQRLCERAPRLYALRIIFWRKFIARLFQLTSKSIRRLELGGMLSNSDTFDKDECAAFTGTPLGQICEVLSIEVQDRKCIVDLVQRMDNLRLLNVRCDDDRWNQTRKVSAEHEIIVWISNRVSPGCQVSRDAEKPSCVQVWIDQDQQARKRNDVSPRGAARVPHVISSIQRFFSKK